MSMKDVLTGIGLGIGFFIGQTLMQIATAYLVLLLLERQAAPAPLSSIIAGLL